MHQKFVDMMNEQENEDLTGVLKEERLIALLKQEFVNADEILGYIKKRNLDPTKFFEEYGLQDPLIMPIRQVDRFKVRKHTRVQQPYMHDHSFYEIIYVRSGSSVQTFEKRPSLTLKKGQAALLCPGVAHSMSRAKLYDVVLKMHIPSKLFLHACVFSDIVPYEGLNIFETLSSDFESVAFKLLDEYHLADHYSENAVLNYLSILLIELIRNRTPEKPEILTKLENYFKDNLPNASLSGFAKMQGYNVVYIGRIVKRDTNKSFSGILLDYKLKKVAELLADTGLSLEEIAYQTGYSNASGLHKQFLKYYGTSPGAYRKRFL